MTDSLARRLTLAILCALLSVPVFGAEAPAPVKLDWLGNAPPPSAQGVSWGVPWPQGTVQREQTFALSDAKGQPLPVQTWPLAYWPDGSLKWTGHALAAPAGGAGSLTLAPGISVLPQQSIGVSQDEQFIQITNGGLTCRVPKKGPFLIESIALAGREVARAGRLVGLREDRSEYEAKRTTREEDVAGETTAATVEQSGPVRAVVKIEGKHKTAAGRAWLPFTVRLYFFAGSDAVKVVHSFVFDGDQEKDFIRGLGVRFAVPLREQFHNRHVRLAGEEAGVFAEPLQVIVGRRNPSQQLYDKQIAGQPIPNLEQLPNRQNIAQMAVWDGYKLTQTTADSYTVQKRTGAHSAWINAAGGKRSLGLAFVGDTTGGLAVGVKNFWQLAPTELEIEKAATDAAELTAWLWSPDAPAMDLRHYDIKEHGLEASYEDIEPGFSTAAGVARTTELTLQPFANTPPNADLVGLAKASAQTPRLVCSPAYYHSTKVFGVWSLPDRSTPAKQWIEEQLDAALSFYQGQIEQRKWYGFWDYGDVMHSYDPTRHNWRYDVGGFAWANTELMPDLWLWYSFLRTGRADVFKMAEAMTRHTQEVDVYHLGRFAGMGSRHNVRHWGDGAKEPRIGQALLKRIYYYLTTDERTGDLMTEVIDADYRFVDVDPLRKVEPKTKDPTRVRVGPDWLAFCSNWLAAWERTGDTKYRDKIAVGAKSMAAMPKKLFSGSAYGYDPKTGVLTQLHDKPDIPHLAALMGGPELCMEMNPLLGLPEWDAAWLHYCRYLQAPADEQRQAIGATITTGRGPDYSRMTGYAAYVTKDPKLAARAWQEFLGGRRAGRPLFAPRKIEGPGVPTAVDEIPNVSTNSTAQWCLNAIELLELVGKDLPETAPAGGNAGRP